MKLAWTLKYAVAAGLALMPAAAWADAVSISYLTHWAPETVALLETAAAEYTETHPDATITVRAVPFGDLLTTLRSSGGGAGGATIAGIYDAWLPDLGATSWSLRCRTRLPPRPRPIGRQARVGGDIGGTLYGIPNEIDVYALNYNKRCSRKPASPPRQDMGRVLGCRGEADRQVKGQQGFGLINSWAAGVLHPFSSLLVSNGGELVVDGKPALDSAGRRRLSNSTRS